MLVFHPVTGHLMLGERNGSPGAWQFPQGGVEAPFSLEQNALREVEEELGIEQAHLRLRRRLEATHQYDYAVTPESAEGKWRGQSQTFWLIEFIGQDNDVRLDRACGEFMGWRWASPSEVRAIVEPIRRPGYEAPLQEFEGLWAKELSPKENYPR